MIPKRAQFMGTALRSFLRSMFLAGETRTDLAFAVPLVRQWRLSSVPRHLATRDVERILRACDRSSATGRRDYAILLLLARLGLRAGEVLSLELGDLHWRAGEIVVRGKGQVHDRLPLLPDVGAALALYALPGLVRSHRSSSAARRFGPDPALLDSLGEWRLLSYCT
jgi:integrase/recombinase XerD